MTLERESKRIAFIISHLGERKTRNALHDIIEGVNELHSEVAAVSIGLLIFVSECVRRLE